METVIFSDDQRIFVNASELRGVQSVSSDNATNIGPANCLGFGFFGIENSGPVENTININQIIVTGADPLANFSNISGHFYYETNHGFIWQSGRLTSYEVSASVNSLVEINSNIEVYGNLIPSTSSVSSRQSLEGSTGIAIANSISIDKSIQWSQLVQSIKYSLTPQWKKQYFLGQDKPEIELTPPIEIDVSIDMKILDYTLEDLSDLCALNDNTITILIKNCDGQTIKTLRAPNAVLDSWSTNGQINDRMVVTLNYKSWSNTTGNLI